MSMCCYTAIPGKTGCLAFRVGMIWRRAPKEKTLTPPGEEKKVVVPAKKRVVVMSETTSEDFEPRFVGGTLEKKAPVTRGIRRYRRNVRAHNATQHHFACASASRVSIRRMRWFLEEWEREMWLERFLDEQLLNRYI